MSLIVPPPSAWVSAHRCRRIASLSITSGDLRPAELVNYLIEELADQPITIHPDDLLLEGETIRWWPVLPGVLVNDRRIELREHRRPCDLRTPWFFDEKRVRYPAFLDPVLRQWVYVR